MLIHTINFFDLPVFEKSIFDQIYQRETSGYVVQNFFSQEETAKAKDIFKQATVPINNPFEGYYALPRPFNFLDIENPAAYHAECNDFQRITEQNGLFDAFQIKLKQMAADVEILYATPTQNNSLSKAWASIRELEVNKGRFDLHCGRMFKQYNSEFYDHFAGEAEIERQLSFFVLIQKPETNCDIEIFDAHWSDYEVRESLHTLRSHEGTVVDVRNLASHKVNMQDGDMLIFDGAHFWHQVPGFGGDRSRYTFGGFITKFKTGNRVMVWA